MNCSLVPEVAPKGDTHNFCSVSLVKESFMVMSNFKGSKEVQSYYSPRKQKYRYIW